jgi:enterobactin synthetase component D
VLDARPRYTVLTPCPQTYMNLRTVPSPPLFDGPVARCSLAFEPDDVTTDAAWAQFFDPTALPASLARAVPKRKAEFLAGRLGARRALAELGLEAPPLPVGPDRSAVWPAGCVGSITHTHGFVSVAAARADRVRSLGVDSERIMREKTAADVRGHVTVAG